MPTILIIDDEESIRFTLESLLEDEGYIILKAESATVALQTIKDNKVDLAIVDLHIPDMNGEELVKKIYATNNNIKFIMHTGQNDYKINDYLKAIGMDSENVLFKPILDLEVLISKLKKILD